MLHRVQETPPFPGSQVFDRYAAFTDLGALTEASQRPLRKSMRVNTLKGSVQAFRSWAQERRWQLQPVPWCAEGFFVERENREEALGKDILHLLGHTYMQEAASMLPVELLDPQPGETILDMSAAPGSKSTQIAAKMQGRGVLVANDVQEKRLWTLKASLNRCGVTNVIVTKKVGQWFAKQMTERFDRVLCDAPCTAQGTSRKDSDALLYSSLENVGKMARLQRELLEAAVHAAKVGGVIVYSTCTLTPEENEEVVSSILNKFSTQVEPLQSGLFSNEKIKVGTEDSARVSHALGLQPLPAIRLWPQTFDTEGFFVAGIRKIAPTRPVQSLEAIRFQEERLPRPRQRDVGEYFEEIYGTTFLQDGDRLFERGSQIVLSTEEVSAFALPVQNYSLSVPFARRLDGNRFRIDHDTATLRGASATKNIVEIDAAMLDALLEGKNVTCDPTLRGDVMLRFGDRVVGTGLAKEGQLLNRLPRWIVQKS